MLNPLMLLGLLGLSVPIIIHLIQRQRLKPQLLATLQFLDSEDVANAFAPIPRDLLQLLMRLILLTLFVLLMGRLAFEGPEPGPRTLAVILDHSLSMQQKLNEKDSLFDRCRGQVLELIDGMNPEDKLSLLLVGDQVAQETGYLQDKAQLRAIAENFEVGDSGALGLVPAIQSAVDQLRCRREVNACVLVFSDHQRVNYLPYIADASLAGDLNALGQLKQHLDESSVKLFLIDDHPEPGANLSLEQAAFSPERVYVGASSRVSAVVRNLTDAKQTTTVTIFEGAQAGQERPLSLEPGETAHIDLVHRFEAPVDSACRIEIDQDVLPGDNQFHLPMRMKDRRQILLVAPASAQTEESAGLELSYQGVDLLAYALNPGEALGLGTGTYINVKRITPQMLERVSLPIYSIVILYGVTDVPEQSIKDLSAFAKNGGGIWLIPDRELSPLRFNETFGPLLDGFAIAQLKTPEQVQPLARGEAQLANPLLLSLVREEWGTTRDIYFSDYYGVEIAGQAAPCLRAANGDWLAAMVPKDLGRVYVQLFSCEIQSSSLPRSTTFVPMIQQVSSVLGQRGEQERPETMRVGEVLHVHLPEYRNLKGDVRVTGPESREFPLTGAQADEIRVQGLYKAGAYEVSHPAKQNGRTRWLTVNPVLGESELAAVSEEEQTRLFGTANAFRLPFAELAGYFSRRHEIAGPLVMLLVLAFIAEALLGAWQSRRGARQKEREQVAA